MMFHKPGFTIDPEISRALDILLILRRSRTELFNLNGARSWFQQGDVFAAVSASIDALWGQLHGGANQAVLEMLEEVRQDGGDVTKAVAKAKDKNSGFRLMDSVTAFTRTSIHAPKLSKWHDAVLGRLGVKIRFSISPRNGGRGLKDPYFKERSLYPNVDFYSGLFTVPSAFQPRCLLPCSPLAHPWLAGTMERND